jgi:hypothetical protein
VYVRVCVCVCVCLCVFVVVCGVCVCVYIYIVCVTRVCRIFSFCVFVGVLWSECDLLFQMWFRCNEYDVCVCACVRVCLQVATLSLNPRLTKVECCNLHQI